MRTITTALLGLALVVLAPAFSRAALMHPDVMGDTVSFTNIEESSPSSDPLPMYGAPGVSDDRLIFPTTGNFSAESTDSTASDQTDGKLSLMVVAKPGNVINKLGIREDGLVLLDAPFGGDAFASVDSFALVKVVEVGGAPVNVPAVPVFLNASPLGGSYQLSTIGGTSYASSWNAGVMVPLPPNTTKVNITLDNNLFAATIGDDTRAFIDKKGFEIDVNTDIPEPTTVLLGMIAVLGVAAVRSRS